VLGGKKKGHAFQSVQIELAKRGISRSTVLASLSEERRTPLKGLKLYLYLLPQRRSSRGTVVMAHIGWSLDRQWQSIGMPQACKGQAMIV
jgi:signal transduction histidine kinase